jgi:hypothetical protein
MDDSLLDSHSLKEAIPKFQANINAHVMKEIQKLLADQQRIRDEIMALRMANLQLENRLELMEGSTLTNQSLQVDEPQSSTFVDPLKPIVIFDLTKIPAVVMTGTE